MHVSLAGGAFVSDPVTADFDRFVAVATAHLAEDGGYGSIPEPEGQQRDMAVPRIFGRTRTSGMAVSVDLVALACADGLTTTDMDAQLDRLVALVQRIGEQGNLEAQRGGQGRQVTALMLWVFAGPVSAEVMATAAGRQRTVRGTTFGRWPVDCAAIALADGRVALPPDLRRRRRTRLAADLFRAWQGPNAESGGQDLAPIAGRQRRRELAGVLSGGAAPATYTLLGLIALFFAAMELSGGSTTSAVLVRFGALVTPLVLSGQWWRLVSAAFLHSGWAHILFNGWALYIYGPLVERLYGPTRFLTIYLPAAIAGDALSLPLVGGISAGASGAIFGLFGATISLVLRHRRSLPSAIREPLLRNAVAVVGINAVLSIAVAGINLYAHAGGFLAGLLLGALLRPRPIVADKRQGIAGAAVGMAVTAVSLVALLLTVVQLLP
ncbi:MAG: rhomboid family intramembrane serine protease [Chloroflexota bacterium]